MKKEGYFSSNIRTDNVKKDLRPRRLSSVQDGIVGSPKSSPYHKDEGGYYGRYNRNDNSAVGSDNHLFNRHVLLYIYVFCKAN